MVTFQVFQRRFDGSLDFYRGWEEYRDGFGDLNTEFWLGNKYLNSMTQSKPYVLRIELGNYDYEIKHAEYESFSIDSGLNRYRLAIGAYLYSSNAGN